MRLPSTKVILFNAAVLIAVAAALVAATRSLFVTAATPPCSERYLQMTAFSLERAGVALTATELQAMSGGRDAGLIENVAVVRKEGPAPLALEVRLPKGATGRDGGMRFPWEPRALAGRTAACLTYHVLLPAGFDFNRGGRLPGLGGSSAGKPEGFVATPGWGPDGTISAILRPASPADATFIPSQSEAAIASGRWVKLDQEVVLNAPKASNGILRIWMNGSLVLERKDMAYRQTDDVSLSTVAAEVHYAGGPTGAAREAKVWLSPLEVRWQ